MSSTHLTLTLEPDWRAALDADACHRGRLADRNAEAEGQTTDIAEGSVKACVVVDGR